MNRFVVNLDLKHSYEISKELLAELIKHSLFDLEEEIGKEIFNNVVVGDANE